MSVSGADGLGMATAFSDGTAIAASRRRKRLLAKLITEDAFDSISVIQEASSAEPEKKNLWIKGIFAQGGVRNKNGRFYGPDMLNRVVEGYTSSHIVPKRSIGELGHPPTPTVNPDRACHLIVDLHRDGNNFMGKSKILESLPMGQIVKGLLDEGVKLGVSTRGMGSLKEKDGIMEVQDDFRLVTVDVVMDPSAPDAWVNGVFEGTEWVFSDNHGWRAVQAAEQTRKFILKATRQQVEERKLAAFQKYINEIGNK